MGEPADEELFRHRHSQARDELPSRNEAVARAKRDENTFRMLVVDQGYETTEVLTKLTRVLAVQTKVLDQLCEKMGIINPLSAPAANSNSDGDNNAAPDQAVAA